MDKRFVVSGSRRENGAVVYVDGVRLQKEDSQSIVNHSPDGFNWGYMGSGPAQLSLAILLRVFGEDFALRHYQEFKRHVVSKIDTNVFWAVIDVSEHSEHEEVRFAIKEIRHNIPFDIEIATSIRNGKVHGAMSQVEIAKIFSRELKLDVVGVVNVRWNDIDMLNSKSEETRYMTLVIIFERYTMAMVLDKGIEVLPVALRSGNNKVYFTEPYKNDMDLEKPPQYMVESVFSDIGCMLGKYRRSEK